MERGTDSVCEMEWSWLAFAEPKQLKSSEKIVRNVGKSNGKKTIYTDLPLAPGYSPERASPLAPVFFLFDILYCIQVSILDFKR